MIFLIKADFESRIETDVLDDITGGDDSLLDIEESNGIDEIIGYLNIRYDVASIFDASESRSGQIVMRLCDIVLYNLHSRIAPDNIPTLRNDRHKEAIEWLEKCADGFISPLLPTKPDGGDMPLKFGNSAEKQNHYY